MFRSLRWRLQAWHALILLIVVIGFGGSLYVETRRARLDEIDAELLSAARVLEGVLRSRPELARGRRPGEPRRPFDRRMPRPEGFGPEHHRRARPVPPPFPEPPPRDRPPRDRPPRDRPPRAADRPGNRLLAPRRPFGEAQAFSLPRSLTERYEDPRETPYFVVWDALGNVIRADPPEAAEAVPIDREVGRRFESHARNRGVLRELSLLGPARAVILVGRPIQHELAGLQRMALSLGLTGLAVFGAGLVGGWWLSSRAVRPIASMSATVSEINATNLSRRLDLSGVETELGDLGRFLNGMLDRLEEAFARQTRFTADASHELRTPLAVILAQVELALSRPREGPAYREALHACERAARRMKTLVEALLTLARSDSGKLDLQIRPIDLGQIAESSASLLEPLARQKGVRLNVRKGPAPLKADPEKLEQVMTNLISNAIQYNRSGGEVTVSTGLEGEEAIVEVTDTGVGISEAELPRIFDRFHRVDEARSRESGGSGLGLSICRGLVEAHGGTIRAWSVLGQGSRFRVAIPRVMKVGDDDPELS